MFMLMLVFIFILVFLVYLIFYLISYKMIYDMECSSGYECGFNLISNARIMFSYRFFLISILFLIFDVEIVLMLMIPYLEKNIFLMIIFFLFLLILILGLMYEYYMGSLEWM